MHYLSSVYFVSQPLHISGIFVAHHQDVYYICIQQLVRIVTFYLTVCCPSSISTQPTDSQLKSHDTYQLLYIYSIHVHMCTITLYTYVVLYLFCLFIYLFIYSVYQATNRSM